jgi:DNA-binding IclR family transcriptional regulator
LAAFRIRAEWAVSDLASHLGISKSMAHRLLQTLAEHRLVVQDPATRRYRVGELIHEISFAGTSGPRLQHVARHLIEEAAREIDETIALCQLTGMRGVCLESRESRHAMRLMLQSGDEFALNAGAIGKALLAYQDEGFLARFFGGGPLRRYTGRTIVDPEVLREEFARIRRAGAAYSDGEITPDASSVAVPVFGASGAVEYCLAASGPTSRFDHARLAAAETVLRDVARKMSAQLGADPAIREEERDLDAVQS